MRVQTARTQKPSQLSGDLVKSDPSWASVCMKEVDRVSPTDPDGDSPLNYITAKGHRCERW